MKIIQKVRCLKGELRVPSDKSISHRAVILPSLAEGESVVENWLESKDTLATLSIIKALGVKIVKKGKTLKIKGSNFLLKEPTKILNAKNSGTTARLMLGVLSTQPFFSVLTGDQSLKRRPMLRVVEPLREMGAKIDGREKGDKLPIAVRGGHLKGISIFNKKASAQVKSCILIAGLRAEGITEVYEPYLSRDHTERMLKAMGVELVSYDTDKGRVVKLEGGQTLKPAYVVCPADPSSAAFFAAGAVLLKGSEVLLKDVLINPTRDGFFRKLREMGVKLSYENLREISGEQVADIYVRYADTLKPIQVKEEEVPTLIDEIPILAILMAFADGVSTVRGAQELRVKESDRIKAIVQNLRRMGAKVEEYEDGFSIEGGQYLKGAVIKTYGDHRIAMSFSIAGLVAEGETIIDDPDCVAISYPEFYEHLEQLAC
ncbi:3-phosphoshikimate 1-carboxyvinyltransferase [Thermocrinis jamiesonii]|uniref:3-phosphoshikimate 1-carboxyvinyltransferase n=1 Tax=Thermocrinis jamiesonii TaxID=1302351 RepID=UPI000496A6C4|nr:3-phosphoshikimate 1-carboxyvinyltransferase [Thermocrinis jamiesonii]